MKKLIFLFLGVFMAFCLSAQKADTIIVKAHQDVVIKTNPAVGRTLYPAWAEFPSVETEYYKVIAYLTFECAPELNCGEWDYINYIRLGKLGGQQGDSLGWEIARYITPYGNYWKSSQNWKHGWYYDLTDYSTLLHDSVQIVYEHTGYETNIGRGWKINLTFYIIPGTPPLSIQNVTPLWIGSYRYGDDSQQITDAITTQHVTLVDSTKTVNIKIIQTGHGMDTPEDCAEFCEKRRTMKFDGNTIDERTIWKECGFNSLYPQAGTWLYDRANWCPGQSVSFYDIYVHDLEAESEHDIDLIMQPYTATGSFGNWTITSYLIEYGEPNYTTDVSIEQIIAPSKEYENLRLNPICGNPIIEIKNNGTDTLYHLTIKYGPKGGNMATFNWTGSLPFLESETIELPGVPDWKSGDGSNAFEVKLLDVNGEEDQFPNNNTAYAAYEPAQEMPSHFTISLKTNRTPTENYYYLINLNTMDTILNKRGFGAYDFFIEEVYLELGCYSLELYDDGPPPAAYPLNKDGLSWWANTYDGSGTFRLIAPSQKALKTFNPDFGTKTFFQFVVTELSAIEDNPKTGFQMQVLPNPSTGIVQIKYNYQTFDAKNRLLTIKDIFGRTVEEAHLPNIAGTEELDLSRLPKGAYIVILSSAKGNVTQKLILQ